MVVPNKNSVDSKKKQIALMFDKISGRYDFLNHFLSFGIDKYWRKKAIKFANLQTRKPKILLDIATGTADFAIEAEKNKIDKIIAIDVSEKMLDIARKKVIKKGLSDKIFLQNADSENLPFDENSFDAITVAFGVRNFENFERGLHEMFRVLKKEGTCIILEFSKPRLFPFKQIYKFYFSKLLPYIGKKISKDKYAYSYLFKSVYNFPEREDFLNLLEKIGFSKLQYKSLTFGIVTVYIGVK